MQSRIFEWIDQFQQKLSLPLAMRVARFARVPLIGVRELAKAPNCNLLMTVLGPFGIEDDGRYTYWQGMKVVVHRATVVAVLCRLDSRLGTGGFYNVKLWDIYEQGYTYIGDPGQERSIHPEGVIRIVTDHLAAQYHVGFVEDAGSRAHDEGILKSNQQILQREKELDRATTFERQVEKERGR